MHITTLERLDRLAEGSTVNVQGYDWTKTGDALVRNGEALPLLSFRGLAEARQITDASAALDESLPAWRRSGDTWYLIVKEDTTAEGYLTITFDRGRYHNIDTYPINTINNMTLPRSTPDIDPAQWLLAVNAITERLMPDAFFGVTEGVTGGLIDALHVHAKDHPDLDALLVEHNVGRSRKGEVTVTARGTAEVKAEQFGNVEVDGTPTVNWKFRYDYPTRTNVTDPCLCVSFDEGLYKTRLPMNVVSEEHATVCTEDDCINK